MSDAREVVMDAIMAGRGGTLGDTADRILQALEAEGWIDGKKLTSDAAVEAANEAMMQSMGTFDNKSTDICRLIITAAIEATQGARKP